METSDPPEIAVYRTPDSTVRPGDIVRLSPVLNALRAPQTHLGVETKKGGRTYVEVLGRGGGSVVPPAVLAGTKETKFAVPGRLDFGVLLTRGCDVDHSKYRQVAAIRPLSTIQGTEHQIAVVEGRSLSLHYLPRFDLGADLLLDRSYVDLRMIVTLHADLFNTLERPVALTREGLLDLYFSWVRHTTGREIPSTLPCPQCGHAVQVLAEVQPLLTPEADY